MHSAARSRSQAEKIRVVRHEETLRHGSTIFLQKIRQDLARECALLDAYSPLKVLERGYSLVEYEGQPVRDVNEVSIGDDIRIRFARGTAEARITKKEEEDHAGKENI
jgi:exodeoxyribonuclease VII large subunit